MKKFSTLAEQFFSLNFHYFLFFLESKFSALHSLSLSLAFDIIAHSTNKTE